MKFHFTKHGDPAAAGKPETGELLWNDDEISEIDKEDPATTEEMLRTALGMDLPNADSSDAGTPGEPAPVSGDTVIADQPLVSDQSDDQNATRVMDPLDFGDEEEEEKKKPKTLLWVLLSVVGALLLLFGVLQILLLSGITSVFGMNLRNIDLFHLAPMIYKELTVEIGSARVEADAFVDQSKNKDGATAVFVRTAGYDPDTLGDYEMTIRIGGREFAVILHVVDTVAPVGIVKPVLIKAGDTVTVEDLVDNLSDRTEITAVLTDFDRNEVGVHAVKISLFDEAGNQTVYKTNVYVAKDIPFLTYEAGSEAPTPETFIEGLDGFTFETPWSELPLDRPGVYDVALLHGDDRVVLPVTVQDTVKPVVTVRDDLELLSSVLPEAVTLLSEVRDATETTVAYKENYQFRADGRYTVTVVVTDLGGNATEVDIPVFIYFSENVTDAPLIVGGDFTVEFGDPVPYRQYIRVIDGVDGEYDLYDEKHITFNRDAVNTRSIGNYSLTFKAVDSEGNSASKTVIVSVVHKQISKEEVDSFVRAAMADVIKPGMTRDEQLQAVFTYITEQSGMVYGNGSDKNNLYYVEGYYGFTLKTGDCYTYCCMAQVILDTLDIDYYVVTRSGTRRSNHYWLLVDFGDGWYHFDACYHVMKWTKPTFKLTDYELNQFTAWYNKYYPGWNYYQFDHSKYPATPVLNADKSSYTYSPYVVTYHADVGGSIIGETFQKVGHGERSATVTAAPAEGYVFKGWSDGILTATRSDVIKCNLNVIAEFTKGALPAKSYLITYEAGEGGYIDGTAKQNVYEGYYGSAVTAVAKAGYLFKAWSDGVQKASRTDIAKSNLTVKALFEKDKNSYTVTYTAGKGGTITGNTTQYLSAGTEGSAVTAVAQNGYLFKKWSDGKTEATRIDTATGNLSLTAEFEKDNNVYTLEYTAGTGGSIVGSPLQKLSAGSRGNSVMAVAKTGYTFKEWSDGYKTATRSDTAAGDRTFTAIFTLNDGYVALLYQAQEGGRIEGNPDQAVEKGKDGTTVTAVAEAGYRFDGWSDGVTAAERTDTGVEASLSVIARFVRDHYEVSFSPFEGGKLTGETKQTLVFGATSSPVTAVPDDGYLFDGWYEGDTLISSEPTLRFVADGSLTVVARFKAAA